MVESKSLLGTPLASSSSLLQSLSLAYKEHWPDPTHRQKQSGCSSLPEAHEPPTTSSMELCQEAPLVGCQIALRCVHHGAFHRSLPLWDYKDFVSFLTCHSKLNLLTLGSKTKVCNEAS